MLEVAAHASLSALRRCGFCSPRSTGSRSPHSTPHRRPSNRTIAPTAAAASTPPTISAVALAGERLAALHRGAIRAAARLGALRPPARRRRAAHWPAADRGARSSGGPRGAVGAGGRRGGLGERGLALATTFAAAAAVAGVGVLGSAGADGAAGGALGGRRRAPAGRPARVRLLLRLPPGWPRRGRGWGAGGDRWSAAAARAPSAAGGVVGDRRSRPLSGAGRCQAGWRDEGRAADLPGGRGGRHAGRRGCGEPARPCPAASWRPPPWEPGDAGCGGGAPPGPGRRLAGVRPGARRRAQRAASRRAGCGRGWPAGTGTGRAHQQGAAPGRPPQPA